MMNVSKLFSNLEVNLANDDPGAQDRMVAEFRTLIREL